MKQSQKNTKDSKVVRLVRAGFSISDAILSVAKSNGFKLDKNGHFYEEVKK